MQHIVCSVAEHPWNKGCGLINPHQVETIFTINTFSTLDVILECHHEWRLILQYLIFSTCFKHKNLFNDWSAGSRHPTSKRDGLVRQVVSLTSVCAKIWELDI
jgi:hypothetical protein